jgi:LAO/AO transport system kinase
VQAVKAGIMEVPQVFVLNKADLPGAKQAASEIEAYLDLVPWPPEAWRPPVVLAAATSEPPQGLNAVWEALQAHRSWAGAHGRMEEARAQRLRRALWREAESLLKTRLRDSVTSGEEQALLSRVLRRDLTPARAAATLVNRDQRFENEK